MRHIHPHAVKTAAGLVLGATIGGIAWAAIIAAGVWIVAQL